MTEVPRSLPQPLSREADHAGRDADRADPRPTIDFVVGSRPVEDGEALVVRRPRLHVGCHRPDRRGDRAARPGARRLGPRELRARGRVETAFEDVDEPPPASTTTRAAASSVSVRTMTLRALRFRDTTRV